VLAIATPNDVGFPQWHVKQSRFSESELFSPNAGICTCKLMSLQSSMSLRATSRLRIRNFER